MSHPSTINRDENYFSLMRMACGIKNKHIIDNNDEINLVNKFPSYLQLMARLTPLILKYAKKNKLFDRLEYATQRCLIEETQRGQIKQIAKSQQLNQIIDWCEKKQIPLILLKGTAFQNTLYAPDAPRLSNDTDILVKETDWNDVVALFGENMQYVSKKRPDVFGDLFELSFIPNSAVGDAVDLHKSLTYPILFSIDENELWESSQAHPHYQSDRVRQLSPEFTIVHQAVHGFSDLDFSKYNLVDSHTAISNSNINWHLFEKVATRSSTRNVVYMLLSQLVSVMGTPVPTTTLARLKPSRLRCWLMDQVLKNNTSEGKVSKSIFYRMIQIVAQYAFTDSIVKPLKFQWLFIKMAVSTKLKKSNKLTT